MSRHSSAPPPSAPRASGSVAGRNAPIAPMGGPAAFGWTFVVTFLFLAMLALVWAVRESAKNDLVTSFSCQAIAYSLGLFLILRVYAPDRSIRDFLALRSTAFALYPIAILFGVVITLPADALYEIICKKYPALEPDTLTQVFRDSSASRRIAMGFVLAGAGPILEEIFFRGALFRPLKRSIAPLQVAVLTGILFAVVHLEWQTFASIFILGSCLGLLRAWSGSLAVSMLVHASFNGVALANLVRESGGADPLRYSNQTILIAGAASILLLFSAYAIASKSGAAARAREADA